MSYYFDPTGINWLFVIIEIAIAFSVIAIVFITYEFLHLETWQVRKIGHILINGVLALTPYFFENFFDIVVTVLILFVIVGILSLLPKVQLLQKLIKYATRTNEKPIMLLINVLITASVILVLFILFYNRIYVYTAAILTLSVADGLGELIGRPYGKIQYKIFAKKSLEGSLGVFFGAIFSLTITIAINHLFEPEALWKILVLSILVTVTESFSFRFFDNITIPCVTAGIMLLLFP